MVFYLVENYIFFTMFITVIYSSQVAGGGGGREGYVHAMRKWLGY